MSSIDKKLCKWHKDDIKTNSGKLVKIVRKPKYLCEKCGRVSRGKKSLCKPVKFKSLI